MNAFSAPFAMRNDELLLKEWPRLSLESLPGILGPFVELATRDSEADPVAVCFTLLVRFCAEIYGFAEGKGPHLFVGETAHPPRLFAVLCGNSSKARKGTSRHPVARLFDRSELPPGKRPLNLPLPARESGGPMSSGEGLAFHLQNDIDTATDSPQNPTSEITSRDSEDKRLFLCDEEFSAALTCLTRQGNTLSMAVRSFWDTGNFSSLTKNSPVKVRNAHLNILTHITQQELAVSLSLLQAVNGFANRFLWICVRRSKLVPMPSRMPQEELFILQQELWRIVSLAQKVGSVALTKKAQELWDYLYPTLSQEHPGVIGSLISRAEAQTLRLALTCALLDGKNKIEEQHLESACKLWDYAKSSALYIFNHWNSSSPIEEKILAALEKGPLTASELNAAFSRNVPKSQVEPVLQRLQEQHRIVIRKEQRGDGRPTTIISAANLS